MPGNRFALSSYSNRDYSDAVTSFQCSYGSQKRVSPGLEWSEMIRASLRRSLASALPKTPWAFHQRKAAIPLRPLSAMSKSLFRSQIPEGFRYAYVSLIKALSSHDYAAMSEFLEGRLYHRVECMLKELEFQGLHLALVDSGERSPEIFNVGMHLGVHLQRIQNAPREDYAQIANLEQLKMTFNREFMQKALAARGINPAFDLFSEDLSGSWIYVGPHAPAKVIVAADVVYRGDNQITMNKGTEDVVYKKREGELHVIRFECMSADLGSQRDLASRGFMNLLPSAFSGRLNLLEAQWEITDIDHVMEGNPYLVSKRELPR